MIKNLEQQLSKTVVAFKDELAGIRANRPTSKLVEDIRVDYLGQKLPIKQLGSISIVPPREIQISIWDKTVVDATVKAIEQASIGVNPSVSGGLIRINLPPLSQERRQELVKLVKQLAETYRIRVRSLRDDCNKEIKKNEQIREDERFDQLKEIQDMIDGANEEIGLILENKVKEIEE